jgi:chromosome segregation ATPase
VNFPKLRVNKEMKRSSAKIADLKQGISDWEAKSAGLQLEADAVKERLADLEAQRRNQLVAALADEDAQAKKQIDQLQNEWDRAAQQSRDLETAFSQAKARAESLGRPLPLSRKICWSRKCYSSPAFEWS